MISTYKIEETKKREFSLMQKVAAFAVQSLTPPFQLIASLAAAPPSENEQRSRIKHSIFA